MIAGARKWRNTCCWSWIKVGHCYRAMKKKKSKKKHKDFTKTKKNKRNCERRKKTTNKQLLQQSPKLITLERSSLFLFFFSFFEAMFEYVVCCLCYICDMYYYTLFSINLIFWSLLLLLYAHFSMYH